MRTRIEADIKAWDSIVDHRTGTPGDRQTAEWLAEEIRASGLEPTVDWFPFERCVLHECCVQIHGHRADGVPLFDSGYTGPQGRRAPLHPLADGTGIGIIPFGPTAAHPETRKLEAARRADRHVAIVAIAAGDDVQPGLSLLNADDYTHAYGPPVLQVATEHAHWLVEAAASRTEAQFTAYVSVEKTEACNVQAGIQGNDPSLKPLVIMTPRSAWWTCTSERAGGITVWLACMRYFAAHPPDRTILFTASTGHELGHVGLDHYLEQVPDLVKGAHAWLHLGANFAARGSELHFQASSDGLMAQGLAVLNAGGHRPAHTTPVGERPRGEARNIYDGNGAYVSLIGSNPWFHHPDDRWPASIDLDRTVAITQAMLAIAQDLARA